MAMDANTASVITAGISAAVALIQAHHAATKPDDPQMTEAQALAILHDAVTQSLAKDEALRKAPATAAQLDVYTGSTGE